jgi:hypothetical protein
MLEIILPLFIHRFWGLSLEIVAGMSQLGPETLASKLGIFEYLILSNAQINLEGL